MSEGGLLALFAIMLAKESGVPVPVPSDLLMVLAGTQLAAGTFGGPQLALALIVAVAAGGSFQFLVLRAAGARFTDRLLRRLGIAPERIARVQARMAGRGALGLFLGLNIPGGRAAVVPAAALARLPYRDFALGGVTGTLVFHAWHIALGYAIGLPALALVADPRALLVAIAAVAAAGLVGWLALRGRRDALRGWSEAACPVCVAATAIEPRVARVA